MELLVKKTYRDTRRELEEQMIAKYKGVFLGSHQAADLLSNNDKPMSSTTLTKLVSLRPLQVPYFKFKDNRFSFHVCDLLNFACGFPLDKDGRWEEILKEKYSLKFFNKESAARLLGVSFQILTQWIEIGLFKAHRIYQQKYEIRIGDILDFARKQRVKF